MSEGHPERHEAARQEAVKDLEALRRPETVFGSTRFSETSRRVADHFAGADARKDSPNDPIELWGRRIGRSLSAIAFVGLAIYLYLTYIR